MAAPQAVEHYSNMAAELQCSRRATDERAERIAQMRKAIRQLCDAEIAFAIVPSSDHNAAEQFEAQMAVERLIGEMR